ncbi:unnamed protein product [Gongylonema pulchrum]|uniref:DUF569 domain-containing protein n=1 Tax=Gongylonema pulchrum TaxID=637853 RepID=A0A183D7V7_9BILA|nr:unnamed protein product [Gongylonema pulchrum]
MWNCSDLAKPRHSLGMLPSAVWKIKFSNGGNDFASIPVPHGQPTENSALSVWKTSSLQIIQVVKCENDVLLDLCWQNVRVQGQTCSCLYSASRQGRLRKHVFPPADDDLVIFVVDVYLLDYGISRRENRT